MRRALLADRAGQPARVEPADGDPARAPPASPTEVARAPVRRLGRVPFHHHALGHRVGGFVILGVHADIADMGEGEGHDLPGIGGVGHDLLIARHRGVEAQLGHALPVAPNPWP
jgi:hypothetical protein